MKVKWLIAGGGVGGLTLAVALARQEESLLVCEQNAHSAEAGAGLLLAPNATRILQRLGLLAEIMQRGRPTTAWYLYDHAGTRLREIKMPADAPPAVSIHRAELLSVLRSLLPSGSVQQNQQVVAISELPHQVTLRCAAGEAATGEGLIGADGLRSVVRQHLFGPQPLRYRGYVGWRGVAPFVPPAYQQGVLSESWGPGGRFGIAPVDAHRTYWYASANAPEHEQDPASTRQLRLLQRFRHWHAPVAELIASTPNEQILVSRIYDGPRLPAWSRGRVTLLGDAAHAMTPNLGQGACLAIEDAGVLASCLLREKLAAAFAQYERQRRFRVSWIQQQSRALGEVVQAESRWALAVRAFLTSCVPEALVSIAARQIFTGIDPEKT